MVKLQDQRRDVDLFEHNENNKPSETGPKNLSPLADRLRPGTLDEFIGQSEFASASTDLLKGLKQHNFLPNLILWGPPGTGKTSFARLLSGLGEFRFVERNAIATGAKELRELGVESRNFKLQYGQRTLLFVDEIHRLNRGQQDVLLPFLEKGDLTLIGATTENPSYNLNSALLSRSKVLRFKAFTLPELKQILERGCTKEGTTVETLLMPEAMDFLLSTAHGDARRLLTNLEILISSKNLSDDSITVPPMAVEQLQKLLGENRPPHDASGYLHYDTISAFIKSTRGGDPDAAVYYLARLLEAGEDPVFIARRLVILASEDVGNADPRGLQIAVAGLQAVELVGLPEAAINLAQVVTYLASAPKSNRSYVALKKAQAEVQITGALPIPDFLRSAQTQLAKSLGLGTGYLYSHEKPRGFSGQNYLPESTAEKVFYEPSDRGFEKTIKQYQAWTKGKLDGGET